MHTQGTWENNGGIIEALPVGRSFKSMQGIAVVGIPNNQTAEDTDNARLICAAPDLLEACKRALNDLQEAGGWNSTMNVLQSAIAKAEGK